MLNMKSRINLLSFFLGSEMRNRTQITLLGGLQLKSSYIMIRLLSA